MPKVPTYDNRTVMPERLPNNGFSVQSSPDAFGAGFGRVGEQYVGLFAEAKQRANVALAQDALLQLQDHADDLFNNPQTGLYTKQGKNAVGQSDEIIFNIESKGQELMSQLPEGSQEDFLKQFNVIKRQYANQTKSYELREVQSFETSRNDGIVAGYAKNASDSFNNPQAFISFMTLGQHSIVEFNRARGISEEEISAKVDNFNNQVAWTAAQNAMATDAMGTFNVIGEPSDIGGVIRVPSNTSNSSSDPDDRNGRNNNPGNIRVSDNKWEGQIGDDGEFVRFATPEHGVRALGKNLLTYRNNGIVTINQIISRYAPEKDGNKTDKYIAFVSDKLGVDPNIPIDVSNIETLKNITTAIMQMEGKHSVTDDQVNTGLQAALGFTRLPQPEASQYQTQNRQITNTNSPWWNLLTPMQQYQIRKQGEAAQSERRKQYSDEISLINKNIYAATDEGLQPTNVPSEAAYTRAYGEYKGLKAYAEVQEQLKYGSIIAAAREVSPDSRSDILEQNRPKDPNAPNFAAQQQRYEKMRIKFNEFDKAWEANQGAQMVSNAINYGIPLDPSSKSNKAATDSYFASHFGNLNLSNEEQVTGVLKLVGNTGIIPTQLLSHLNAAAVTQDAKTVLPAANFVSRLYETNPTAITGMSKEKQAFYLNVKQFKDAGASDDESIKIAFDQVYNQTDAVKIQLADEKKSNGYKKEVLNAAESFINERKEIFRIDPSASDETPEAKAFLRDYKLLYDANFDKSGGNADTAKKITHQQISNRWSITEINGKAELMKYAPEALHKGGPDGWQAKQWEEEKWKLKYGEERKNNQDIGFRVNNTTGGIDTSENKPKPIVDGEIILVVDHNTPRNGDYAIFISKEDKNGIPTLQPYYDESGSKIRWRPELDSYKPYQDLLSEIADTKAQQKEKLAKRINFKNLHDEFDKQYEQAHEQRIERQKEQLSSYFSWGGNK
ncbi:hypothetical protein [Proteus terrae]|uniref:hypothetical protein n=1 Tax=Proteus terrae TaxID=1574161 RepID=UPI001C600172|nr:hypothetical protein [Proteus terrae]